MSVRRKVDKRGRFTFKGVAYQITDKNYHDTTILEEELLELIADGRAYEKQKFTQKHIGVHNVRAKKK